MKTEQIIALLKEHNLPAVAVGNTVCTKEVFTVNGEPGEETKFFKVGCLRSEILNWLGY